MAEEKPKTPKVWNTVKPFVNGGASGMLATCVIQPVDMIKMPGLGGTYLRNSAGTSKLDLESFDVELPEHRLLPYNVLFTVLLFLLG